MEPFCVFNGDSDFTALGMTSSRPALWVVMPWAHTDPICNLYAAIEQTYGSQKMSSEPLVDRSQSHPATEASLAKSFPLQAGHPSHAQV